MDYSSPVTSRRSSTGSIGYETNYSRPISQESSEDIDNRFITEICQLLSLDETEDDSRIIAKQLLINGRQALVRHRDHIAPIDFDNQMDKKGNSTLLKVLKRYCEQQWQQNSLDWFNKFITEQQSLDNDQHYQKFLTRTAEYGPKYMKECPVFSIVLQLVFAFDNDINTADSIFDEIWKTFVLDGCNIALKKWKKYIVSAKIKEYINLPNSPLFRALCEYFREPVLSLFDQSKISDRQNLLDITLDCLANNGWTASLDDERVKERISPKKYASLMTYLEEYLKKNWLILPVPNTPRMPPKQEESPIKKSPILHLEDEMPSSDTVIAYIPELPLTVADSRQLEDMIRRCLKRKHKQEIIDVKCNPYLGIGKVYLQNSNEKDHLIHVLKSIVLEFEKEDIIIKFTSDLELISYVVIESTNDEILPSSNEIARRWVHIYKSTRPPLCEQDFIQFPNIFRVVSDSLDELTQAMSRNQFSIGGQSAMVYFRADRTFLEDLPTNTSTTQLRDVITNQISRENISTESCYIQYNKEAATAIIITCNKARKWALYNSINLNGQVIMKKTSLSYRLIVTPIPKDFPIKLIQNHRIFENSIRNISSEKGRIILELSDKVVYERCVNQGALSVADQLLRIETYTLLPTKPDIEEINAENWYETEMCRHKSDIMLFTDNRQHPIFHWKWNPQAFQEQLQRYTAVDHGTGNNKKRHLLRTTVMLNTIGSVWKGSYRIAEREIEIKGNELQTIVYDHRSTLQRSVKMPLSEAIQVPYPSTLIKVVDEDCLYVYQRLVAQRCRPVVLNMANAHSPGGGYRKGDGAQEETLFRRSNYFQSLDIDLDYGMPTSRLYCNSNCDLETLSDNQQMYPMDEFGAIYTSGLTVFRQAEDTGYAFMDKPLYDVCAIAMAAYRDPTVENNRLVPKFSIGMRKKIENIFAIAYHHKHDCLILSALGCGAFKNPPEHVAAIFQSVAKQYAGFFKSIYFAIVDDHNTGLQFNPQGNYRPFQQLLDGTKIRPKEHKLQDMMIGPWRILKMSNPQQVTLSDIRICYLTPCYHGGQCNDVENVKHSREYSHPALCPSVGSSGKTCKLSNDEDHTLWFIHVPVSDLRPSPSTPRPKANNQPLKLNPCPAFFNCLHQDDTDHMKKYSHPCQYSELCRQKDKEPYLTHECYVLGRCTFGQSCKNLDNPTHRATFRHVDIPDFLIPCRYQQQCRDKSNDHRIKYSHGEHIDIPEYMETNEQILCRDGLQCRRIHDAHHRSKYLHPDKFQGSNHHSKTQCKYGSQCRKMDDPRHRSEFSHPDY